MAASGAGGKLAGAAFAAGTARGEGYSSGSPGGASCSCNISRTVIIPSELSESSFF